MWEGSRMECGCGLFVDRQRKVERIPIQQSLFSLWIRYCRQLSEDSRNGAEDLGESMELCVGEGRNQGCLKELLRGPRRRLELATQIQPVLSLWVFSISSLQEIASVLFLFLLKRDDWCMDDQQFYSSKYPEELRRFKRLTVLYVGGSGFF